MAKVKKYEGFGEMHGLREWARLLDVNKDTLRYWLTTKGKTLEEFVQKNKLKYKTSETKPARVNEDRVAQAEELLTDLFIRSRYNHLRLEITRSPGAKELEVRYAGHWVGLYHLYHQKQGILEFTEDRGIDLLHYPVENPEIIWSQSGGWDVHPDTKRKLFWSIYRVEGFGQLKTIKEWADALSLPAELINVNLDIGSTIEKIAADRGIEYK